MSVSLKVMFPCDHVVVDRIKLYGNIEMTRNKDISSPDKVPGNLDIIRVDGITNADGSIYYTNGIDYEQKVSTNIIEWLNDKVPAPGEKYLIRCSHVKTLLNKYSPEDCNRCGGNGWYLDMFSQDSNKLITGSNKLCQDFVKILFTEKRLSGYGCNIKNVLAENIYDESELSLTVSSAIDDCAEQLKQSQLSLVNNGASLDVTEALDSVVIKNIVFAKEDLTCYVLIEIRNVARESINFSFMIN